MKATCQSCNTTFEYTKNVTGCPGCSNDEAVAKGKTGPYAHHHRGPRTIGGKTINFANRMEFNYYAYLYWLKEQGVISDFEYQPDYFDFKEKYNRRNTRYRPDFRVVENEGNVYYVETKGYMDADSKTKLKRMKEMYPEIEVRLVGNKEYQALSRTSKMVPGWEV